MNLKTSPAKIAEINGLCKQFNKKYEKFLYIFY